MGQRACRTWLAACGLLAVTLLAAGCAAPRAGRCRLFRRPMVLLARPEHYAPAGFKGEAVAGADSDALEEMLLACPSSERPWYVTDSVRGESTCTPRYRKLPRVWRMAEPHEYLGKVLPGVDFYSVEVARAGEFLWPEYEDAQREELVAVHGGQVYFMGRDLNRLLWDSGMRFTDEDIGTWVRVSAILWTALERGRMRAESREGGVKDYWELPLFPEMTLSPAEWEIQADAPGNPMTVSVQMDDLAPKEFSLSAIWFELPLDTSRVVLVPWMWWQCRGYMEDIKSPRS